MRSTATSVEYRFSTDVTVLRTFKMGFGTVFSTDVAVLRTFKMGFGTVFSTDVAVLRT